jgi:hypothetical protein
MGGSEEGRKAREKATEAKALCKKAVADGGSSDVWVQKLAREIWHNHNNGVGSLGSVVPASARII